MFPHPAPRIMLVLALLAGALALPVGAGASSLTSAESSLLAQINRVRAAHGLRPLRYDARLARAARAHTQDMARKDYFAHGAFGSRMVRFHVEGPFVGENLAWGSGSYGTPRGIVTAWLHSPEHRRNLLHAGFRRVGVAEVDASSFQGADDARVVTADFAGS
ncbi:MAG TPA: CAP domain-containing protein [Gaiellaceae bacterium]|jgi:uncharacterized protein YkwD|nr:CAP domain-containing protein [Gaiellaceae bacterium]